MALNNSTADSLASSVSSALAGLSDGDKNDAEVIWQTILRLLYAALKTDVTITITTNAITTTGSATTQTGPGAPININPA